MENDFASRDGLDYWDIEIEKIVQNIVLWRLIYWIELSSLFKFFDFSTFVKLTQTISKTVLNKKKWIYFAFWCPTVDGIWKIEN